MNVDQDALTVRLANQYCNSNGIDCRWYHGDWELLKALGIVSTSGVHEQQLSRLLQSALHSVDHTPRILLSGSTDDTLLRVVDSGTGGRGAEVVAVDLCATPLELMREYAQARKLSYSSNCTDILSYSDHQGFDLILTHAFMGNFDSGQRAQLVKKWASLLRNGGSVATIQRIRPTDSPALVRFSREQKNAFLEGAMDAARRLGFVDIARVEQVARAFTEHFMSHAITSKSDFEQLFTDAGLHFRHLEYQALAKLPGLSGPSVPSGGEYAHIVASKEAGNL